MLTIIQRLRHAFASEYKIWPSSDREFTYREQDHQVRIIVEAAFHDQRGDAWIDATSTVRWNAPHNNELIPEEKRELILQRLVEDLQKKDKWSAWIERNPAAEDRERREAEKVNEARRGSGEIAKEVGILGEVTPFDAVPAELRAWAKEISTISDPETKEWRHVRENVRFLQKPPYIRPERVTVHRNENRFVADDSAAIPLEPVEGLTEAGVYFVGEYAGEATAQQTIVLWAFFSYDQIRLW